MLTVKKACKILEPLLGIPRLDRWAAPLVSEGLLPSENKIISDHEGAILLGAVLASHTPDMVVESAGAILSLVHDGKLRRDESSGLFDLYTCYDEGTGESFLSYLEELFSEFSEPQSSFDSPVMEMETGGRSAVLGFKYWNKEEWVFHSLNFIPLTDSPEPRMKRFCQIDSEPIIALATELHGTPHIMKTNTAISMEIH